MPVCIACNLDSLEFFGKRKGYSYTLCKGCSTLQLSPMPSDTELSTLYAEKYATSGDIIQGKVDFEAEEVNRMNFPYHSAIVDSVIRLRPTQAVLEVGSGYGGMCRLAIQAGLKWEGVDLSLDAAQRCQAAGLPVRYGSLFNMDEKFGGIVMCFVFEHLTNYDTFLAGCRERLASGGFLLTLHPSAEFPRFAAALLRLGARQKDLPQLDCAFVPPWHTCLISSQGIRAAAERNGFRLESLTPAPIGNHGSLSRRAAQLLVSMVNAVGWKIVGLRWPLIPAHIAVLRRVD